jgi:hypothetical protein
MSRILIPDAGPLFSLAAGDLLHLLSRFHVGISDLVREETIDRGHLPNASIEAQRLLSYYNANSANIQTFTTQVGMAIKAKRSVDPNYQTPRNVGELSVQSLLIELQVNGTGEAPVVLFEDAWFINNAPGLAKPCILLSTEAFLEYAQSRGWIESAEVARQSIVRNRPGAYNAVNVIHQGTAS